MWYIVFTAVLLAAIGVIAFSTHKRDKKGK